MVNFDSTGSAGALPQRKVAWEEIDVRGCAPKGHVAPVCLEKWYADVFDGTSVRVSYRARLKLGPLTLGYLGGIGDTGRSSRSFVVAGTPLPVENAGMVIWPAQGTQPELSWTGSCSREHRLWQCGSRVLHWNPLVLNGQVLGEGVPPASRGYVERLAINCGPWQLGLERLKWGRFCGERHSLVWIEWEGRNTLQLALLDGFAHPVQLVTVTHVCGEDVLLRLGTRRLLLQEPMAEGALRGLRLPRQFAGLRFLRGVETKWFAFGELQLRGGELDQGHAVFEEVTWH